MSRQYLRSCSLIVSGLDGDGLDLSQLRIEFKVKQLDKETPNSAQIRIWNLSRNTSLQIENEFTRVTLQAGYGDDDKGMIFDGTIVQVRRGRANATDTFLDISAADGDAAYNYGIIALSVAAGARPEDQYDVVTRALEKYGVTAGEVQFDKADPALPRGKVMFGMARDYFRDLAKTTNTSWSIQDGRVNMVADGGYLPGEAVVLNSESGMIGIPEQTVGGINVRCLLNPRLKYSGRIQLNEGDLNRAAQSLAATSPTLYLPRIVEDGFYRIVVCDHEGDTRGDDWYSNLICVALDDTATPALLARGLS